MIVCFLLFMLFLTFIDLSRLNHPCILGINPAWSWWVIFSKYVFCLQVFYCIFLAIFISDIGLLFSFFVVSLPSFDIRVIPGFVEELGRAPSVSIFFFFLDNLRRIECRSSLKVWENSVVYHMALGCFFLSWKAFYYCFNFLTCYGSV